MILDTLQRAQQLCPEPSLSALLADLGLPEDTYYRWQERQAAGQLADRVVVPHRTAVRPTPGEAWAVLAYALAHPLLGYKRLAYALVAENQAFLRPWMVYDLLAEADHADLRWHTDLTTWWFGGQWFWLIDVLDAYRRYLVHCEVLLTARADGVVFAAQRALDMLTGRERRPREPEIVHDGGPQFIGHEWAQFAQAVKIADVRTHLYHPQSNGRDERAHRTWREELPLDEHANLYQARAMSAEYRVY